MINRILIPTIMSIMLVACDRTIREPSDKKTKFIFTNETHEDVSVYGYKNRSLVKIIFIEKSNSYTTEMITPKTFAFQSDLFNFADSSAIVFESGKKIGFTISHRTLFLKCPLVSDNYVYNKIKDNYVETTYKITNEFLDSAR